MNPVFTPQHFDFWRFCLFGMVLVLQTWQFAPPQRRFSISQADSSCDQAVTRPPIWTRRRMLYPMFAMPILVLARARPMVRTAMSIMFFWTAKTCSTGARCFDFVALPRRMCLGMALPLGLRRWTWLTKQWRARNVSFCFERYALSAQTPDPVLSLSSRPRRSMRPSCFAASVTSHLRMKRNRLSMELCALYPKLRIAISGGAGPPSFGVLALPN